MLGTLQHIVQQVNEAANLDEALASSCARSKKLWLRMYVRSI